MVFPLRGAVDCRLPGRQSCLYLGAGSPIRQESRVLPADPPGLAALLRL